MAYTITTTTGTTQVNGTFGYASNDAGWTSQSFTTTDAGDVSTITVEMRKVNSPTDNVTIELFAVDGSNKPTGAALGTAGSVAGSGLPTAAGTDQVINLGSTVSLAAATNYCVVFKRDGAFSSTNFYIACGESGAAAGVPTGNYTTTTDTSTWAHPSGAGDTLRLSMEVVTSAAGPANLKSYNINVLANIKSINTNLIANVKSLNTNV